MKSLLILSIFLVSCANPHATSTKLQGHIGQARTASDETSRHIGDFKSTADTISYKTMRAKKLLDQGIEKPF